MKKYCYGYQGYAPTDADCFYRKRTTEDLIERSTLLDVVCRYLDTHEFPSRTDLSTLIGHKLPAQTSEAPHDPLS